MYILNLYISLLNIIFFFFFFFFFFLKNKHFFFFFFFFFFKIYTVFLIVYMNLIMYIVKMDLI